MISANLEVIWVMSVNVISIARPGFECFRRRVGSTLCRVRVRKGGPQADGTRFEQNTGFDGETGSTVDAA